MGFDIDPSYKEVPERIADLKKVHPDAVLRPVNESKPFEVVAIGDKTFIVYAAACYRTPDDMLPGIGVAWEPFPGRTPYTRDSELMNAETSAWGRAIVAALRSESKAIASANEVRNRKADQEHDDGNAASQGRANGRSNATPASRTRRPPPNGAPRAAADPETGEVTPSTNGNAAGPSDAQLRYLGRLGKDIDLSTSELLTVAGSSVGRSITALDQLSAAEASTVIDQLRNYAKAETN